ncbi:hypothetical protein NX059_007235 [Plenodomus lindquistii]|nr:hypothetical protein NX059_007235 [Plenodomus lindquistii]
MKFITIIAALAMAITVTASGNPCCSIGPNGECGLCPKKRTMSLTHLATRWAKFEFVPAVEVKTDED